MLEQKRPHLVISALFKNVTNIRIRIRGYLVTNIRICIRIGGASIHFAYGSASADM